MYLGLYGAIKINNVLYNAITPALDQVLSQANVIGWDVLSADGSHRYQLTRFAVPAQFGGGEGWLLDGCPLNVIFGQGWITNPDQIGALKAAGVIPTCLVPGSAEYIAFFGQPAPAQVMAPIALPPPPPGATAQGWQASGAGTRVATTTTGVTTPTIVVMPDGSQQILSPPAEPPAPSSAVTGTDWLPVVAIAGLALLLFRR
jgi:hypothetical protein